MDQSINLEVLVPVLFVAMAAAIAGLMFLKGYFHEDPESRWRRGIDPDKILCPNLHNKRLILAADRLAFWLCESMASFLVVFGILASVELINSKPAVSLAAAGLLLVILSSWVIRYLFIFLLRNKTPDEIPSMWPFDEPG